MNLLASMRYLVALGHRRIARGGGLPDLLHTQTRTRAFEEVCTALGLNEASRQRTSMGIAIVGGLISSTLLNLAVLPALAERFGGPRSQDGRSEAAA